MKKTAFSILACLLSLCFAKAKAQTHYSSTHAHRHLWTGVGSIIYDPHGTGQIQEQPYLSVADHPNCTIVKTSIYVTIESANNNWVALDITGSSDQLSGTVNYNWFDEIYWISYGWEVEYSDGTLETETHDVYY